MKDFVKMSESIGAMPDYVQGGGGNVSYKHDSRIMSVKASGFAIKDITETSGYVDVDYAKIAQYHKENFQNHEPEMEQLASAFVKSCICGDGALRPSVETGFHSIMKKYVIHTHSVYTNIPCCASNGLSVIETAISGFDYISVPYINPGFMLTVCIYAEMEKYKKENGKTPNVIFLKNHGLITTADTAEECLRLHIDVNEAIRTQLGIKDAYPAFTVSAEAENIYACNSDFVTDFIPKNGLSIFKNCILYPDQLVYLNSAIADGKLTVDDNKTLFHGTEKEADAVFSTLVACAYVMQGIRDAGLECVSMDESDRAFINNWESEKYRKSVNSGNTN